MLKYTSHLIYESKLLSPQLVGSCENSHQKLNTDFINLMFFLTETAETLFYPHGAHGVLYERFSLSAVMTSETSLPCHRAVDFTLCC